MSTNSEYVAGMAKQLKQWDADVAALAAKGEKAIAEARVAHHKKVKDLRSARESAHKTLHEVRTAKESTEVQIRAGMEAVWTTMQTDLAKMAADLRK